MPSEVRITVAVARVLREFLDDVSKPRYGYELMQVTGYASGKLYPILSRLAAAGRLIREREDVEFSRAGRPVRYTYRLRARADRWGAPHGWSMALDRCRRLN